MTFKEKMPKNEAREVQRYGLSCDLAVVYEGDTEEIPVHPPNLTTQGMFINTAEHFPIGSVLKLHFRLVHTGFVLDARAEVRHCVPGVGIGVEFVGLPPAALRAIREEIQMISPPWHAGR